MISLAPGRTLADRRQRLVDGVDELAHRLDGGPLPRLEGLEHLVGELGGPVDHRARLLALPALSLVTLAVSAPLRAAALRWALVSGIGFASLGTCVPFSHRGFYTGSRSAGTPESRSRVAATASPDRRPTRWRASVVRTDAPIGRNLGRGWMLHSRARRCELIAARPGRDRDPTTAPFLKGGGEVQSGPACDLRRAWAETGSSRTFWRWYSRTGRSKESRMRRPGLIGAPSLHVSQARRTRRKKRNPLYVGQLSAPLVMRASRGWGHRGATDT